MASSGTQAQGYRAEIESIVHLSSGRELYKYTITTEREHTPVYDGVAGDLRDAMETASAHIRFLNEGLSIGAV